MTETELRLRAQRVGLLLERISPDTVTAPFARYQLHSGPRVIGYSMSLRDVEAHIANEERLLRELTG